MPTFPHGIIVEPIFGASHTLNGCIEFIISTANIIGMLQLDAVLLQYYSLLVAVSVSADKESTLCLMLLCELFIFRNKEKAAITHCYPVSVITMVCSK